MRYTFPMKLSRRVRSSWYGRTGPEAYRCVRTYGRRRHRRSRHAVLDGLNERASPRCLILVQQLAEKIVQQKIGELRILVVSLLDLSEEPAADDAAAAPHER